MKNKPVIQVSKTNKITQIIKFTRSALNHQSIKTNTSHIYLTKFLKMALVFS